MRCHYRCITVGMTFGPFSSVASILGLQVWDASSGGNMLLYGTLLTASTVGVGDSLVVPESIITLS